MASPSSPSSPPPKRARLAASPSHSAKNGDDSSSSAASPPSSRPRDDDAVRACASTLEELRRRLLHATTDPHLQARLLLAFSAAASAPAAHTEAAIDFLFSFLQQNQQRSATASTDASETTAPNSNSNNANSTVVVGAIVRGLRALLAVKPRVVEPMIQLDAMAEQLTQCVSVAEDSKLRRDMTRIVLDCLLLAGDAGAAVRLLDVCVCDHDAGLRRVCLGGFLALVDRGERLPPAVCARLDTLLVRLLARAPTPDVRQLSARLLSALAQTQASVNEQTTALVLAAAARDASDVVRCELALALRGLATAIDRETRTQLLLKSQISEALEDVETQHARMMASGALLSLLEDDDPQVAVEAARTIVVWSQAGVAQDALLRVTHALVDAAVAHSREPSRDATLALLLALERVMTLPSDASMDTQRLNSEEIHFLLSVVPSDDARVLRAVCRVLSLLPLAHQRLAASSVVDTLTSLSTQSVTELIPSGAEALRRSVAAALEAVGRRLAPGASTFPSSLLERLNEAAAAKDELQYRAFCARALLHALSPPRHQLAAVLAVAGERSSAELAASLTQMLRKAVACVHGRLENVVPSITSLQVLGAVSRPLTDLEALVHEIHERCEASLPRHALQEIREAATLAQVARLVADATTSLSVVVDQLKTKVQDTEFAASLHRALDSTNDTREQVAARVVDHLERWRPRELLLVMDNGRAQTLRVASAIILTPSPSLEPREVTSQLPLRLRVRCVLRDVESLTRVVVRTQLPDGRVLATPLNGERCRVHQRGVTEGEADVSVRVPPFSDPTQLLLTVCLRSSRSTSESFAVVRCLDCVNVLSLSLCLELTHCWMQQEQFVAISPVVAISIQHRALAPARHNSRT
ncbi:hypothetical protein PINS_up015615 [Pythium insidiosum]|nr:hypothetical protein PINS_up015615 [Pythium insidiosum]